MFQKNTSRSSTICTRTALHHYIQVPGVRITSGQTYPPRDTPLAVIRQPVKGGSAEYPQEQQDVVLRQGSALSSFLFIIIMDVLARELGSKPRESMPFAGDIVLCDIQKKMEREESWRDQFESHGLCVCRTKAEYPIPPSTQRGEHKTRRRTDANGKGIQLSRESSAAEGWLKIDVNKRVNVVWYKWREVSRIMYDKKMHINCKDKIFKIIIKPAVESGSEWWESRKKIQLHTTEMRMLRWARGKTKKNHIKNERIWRGANIEPMTMFLRQKP